MRRTLEETRLSGQIAPLKPCWPEACNDPVSTISPHFSIGRRSLPEETRRKDRWGTLRIDPSRPRGLAHWSRASAKRLLSNRNLRSPEKAARPARRENHSHNERHGFALNNAPASRCSDARLASKSRRLVARRSVGRVAGSNDMMAPWLDRLVAMLLRANALLACSCVG